MRIELHVTQADKDRVKTLINGQRQTVLMSDRLRNLVENKDQITKQRLWRAIVFMRLTGSRSTDR
jgi:hypothetical protein